MKNCNINKQKRLNERTLSRLKQSNYSKRNPDWFTKSVSGKFINSQNSTKV